MLHPLAVPALLYAGWAAWALAMDRHHRQVAGGASAPLRRLALRLGGGLCLLAAFAVSVFRWGWNIGPVVWCVLLSVMALGFVLAFAFRPRLAALGAPPLLLLVALAASF
ncbi:DUF3325 domain-containing protein [Pseudomonas schmalbachii]|uniref:DUF3325 domain-containing protein n=1 Tax=Pseudomonas schmalbachii TaxID=2816993 RepID=A0ABS3TKX2_9PSED|nr:DUF3325 domain-containing protein [Pseudomonas schmalbachii]MBO3274296.1 DUF3325 domain-containing protein [Pseudomonas schmalbachii]